MYEYIYIYIYILCIADFACVVVLLSCCFGLVLLSCFVCVHLSEPDFARVGTADRKQRTSAGNSVCSFWLLWFVICVCVIVSLFVLAVVFNVFISFKLNCYHILTDLYFTKSVRFYYFFIYQKFFFLLLLQFFFF